MYWRARPFAPTTPPAVACSASLLPIYEKGARDARSALRGAAAVDLPAHQGDRLLIDRGGVPALDRDEVRLSGLIPHAGAPAVALEEIRRRVQRARRAVEIA